MTFIQHLVRSVRKAPFPYKTVHSMLRFASPRAQKLCEMKAACPLPSDNLSSLPSECFLPIGFAAAYSFFPSFLVPASSSLVFDHKVCRCVYQLLSWSWLPLGATLG